jgi:hypothetical protein
MSANELPIACNLTPPEFQIRRTELLGTFREALLETRELDDGFAFRFPADEKWITGLAQLITFERECCPFLRFELQVEAANGPVWLELTGPEGTKDFLKSLFAE